MRNMDSIQAYVTNRYNIWVQYHGFGLEERNEIIALLSPIAGQAKGNLYSH
jgi:hypothetical protein